MTATIDLLHRVIADSDTLWSLGTFGAIAEFLRDHDEPVRFTRSTDGVSAVTARGIAIRHFPNCRPVASESISNAGWNQRITLCLPEADSRMGGRTGLTEIGADHAALRREDRAATLFDLGLGLPHADFCVRYQCPKIAVGAGRGSPRARQHRYRTPAIGGAGPCLRDANGMACRVRSG
jgi:hypothetical protein